MEESDRELKPCPYCGSEHLIVSGGDLRYVACKACESNGPPGFTNAQARASWNCRAPEAAARLEALSVGVGREAIARIIDARAFLDEYPDVYASRQRAAADYWVEERKLALAKADSILALSPGLVSGGGEDEGSSCTESTDAPCSASSAAAEATACDLGADGCVCWFDHACCDHWKALSAPEGE